MKIIYKSDGFTIYYLISHIKVEAEKITGGGVTSLVD